MTRVVIAVDPHKLSATIEAVDDREKALGGGRFGTDRDGCRQHTPKLMLVRTGASAAARYRPRYVRVKRTTPACRSPGSPRAWASSGPRNFSAANALFSA